MFSVLLSIYKKEHPAYFKKSLDSIFSQTLLPDEIVLVKDGPLTDELEDLIREYQQKYSILKVIPLPINQGLGKALNEGLKYCSYDLVARMDTDDISKPDRFEKQIKIFQEHPELDVVGAWIEEFEGDTSKVTSIRKLPEQPSEIYEYGKKRSPINHPCVMYRKSAVLRVGGYHKFPEDYYLWGYMLKAGCKFYNIQESLLYFRFSRDVFRRRGGWSYAMKELALQCELLRIGYINYRRFVLNVMIRFTTRMMPNRMREIFYKRMLRK
ncbi:glycosyltransferase family 2 protein [Phocaeicola sartorii]|jgi:glycosyltransferase involved in cell wall biosynthesis|uniref:glycosyltransferase family 2 protein n=1 Tax=Phocaeicola sartorii TaxID=671267 RepID=UPI0025907B1B|nr:glycosyltransferase [Phocaeicola sartorii]